MRGVSDDLCSNPRRNGLKHGKKQIIAKPYGYMVVRCTPSHYRLMFQLSIFIEVAVFSVHFHRV